MTGILVNVVKCQCGKNCLEIWIIGKVLCYDLQSNLSLFICAYNCVRIFFINRILLSIWNRSLSNIFDRESWFERSKKKFFHLLQWDSSVLQSLSYVSCKIFAKPLFWHICLRSLYFLTVLFLNTWLLINIFRNTKDIELTTMNISFVISTLLLIGVCLFANFQGTKGQ